MFRVTCMFTHGVSIYVWYHRVMGPDLDEAEVRMLSLATELADGLEGGSGAMALKVLVLVQYVDSDGLVTDAFFHAGGPRYVEMLGLLASHRLRVEAWMMEGWRAEDG